MLVTSQLLIQTAKILYNFFDVRLCPPTLKKVPPSMVESTPRYGSRTIWLCKQTQQPSQRFSSCGYYSDCRAGAIEFVLRCFTFPLWGKVCAFGQGCQMVPNLANVAKNHCFPNLLPISLTIFLMPKFCHFPNTNCGY